MRRLAPLVALVLAGCCAETALPPFSPHDVVRWADLDRTLSGPPLAHGEADGRAVLGGRVLALNAAELRAFLARHGYAGHGRAERMRRVNGTTLDVEVVVRGRDGATFRLILRSDGQEQGRG